MAVAYVSKASNSASASSVTITTGSLTDGYILWVLAQTGGAGSAAITSPGGSWATINTGTHGDGSRYGLFRLVCSSAATTHAFSSSDATSMVATGWWFSGGNTTTPEDTTTTKTTGSTSTQTWPSITTVNDGSMVLYVNSNRSANVDGANIPSGYTDAGASEFLMRGAYKLITTAGTESPANTTATAASWVSYGIAIRDAAAGGGGTTRGTPFGHEGTAFNGGRTFMGIIR